MLDRIGKWIRGEKVLCIAGICALLTMFLVPPDGMYAGYIDLRVLCLLLCLMAVVSGFQSCGAFRWLAVHLLERSRNGCVLSVVLVMLPFFCAMLVTNDVALLTFVPFTLLLLEQVGAGNRAIPILVLQTMAANLGSMATPVGNPQNLYLYAVYELSANEFFQVMLPLTVLSFLCLAAASLPVLPGKLPVPEVSGAISHPARLMAYAGLFLLCLLTVFRVMPYGIMMGIVILVVVCMDRRLLLGLDYALLATFVCFFVVSGNLGRVDAVREILQQLLDRSTLLTAAVTSQVISNVPAAVLLSEFTGNWRELLEGVNIGGLGTPIASLASLITLKLYLAWPGAKAGRYLLVFTASNILGLAVLLVFAIL